MNPQEQINITITQPAGTVKFGTDDAPGTVRKVFPDEFITLMSVELIDYNTVWEYYFTDKFFELSPALMVDQQLQAARQSCVHTTDHPHTGEKAICVSITLPGRIPPNELLALMTNATFAGYAFAPPRVRGTGCSAYTEFRLMKEQ